MKFLLGVPEPSWCWNGAARGSVFVSAARLRRRRTPFPRAVLPGGAEVCIDSGGYSELLKHGRWCTPAAEYAELVTRAAAELGAVGWAACQDWMCEPWLLAGGRPPGSNLPAAPGTGLTVLEHQRRTTESLLELRQLAPAVRWLPVVQGQTTRHYLEHVDGYARAGVDLTAEPLVGVGSVCRRNRSEDIGVVLRALQREGLRLHGFGVKAEGLARYSCQLDSADSMAWSYRERRKDGERWRAGAARQGLANSQARAEEWRAEMLAAVARKPTYQLALDLPGGA